MKRYLAVLIAVVLLAGSLVACDAAQPAPSTPTATPPPAATPTTAPAPSQPPATPTPDPRTPSATPDPNGAPPFAEIRAQVDRIKSAGQQTSKEIEQQLMQYTTGLVGKTAQEWDGWIAWYGKNDDGSYFLVLAAIDPYAPSVKLADENNEAAPRISLDHVPAAQALRAQSGQQVRFSGALQDVSTEEGLTITIDKPAITWIDPTAAGPTPALTLLPATANGGRSEPTGTVAAKPSRAESAPSFAEFEATIKPLSWGAVSEYAARLTGKQVDDWEGWVTGPANTEVDAPPGAWLLTVEDPYTPLAIPTAAPLGSDIGAAGVPALRIILTLAASDGTPPLQIGDQVRFSGKIQRVDTQSTFDLWLSAGSASLIENRLPPRAAGDLAGTIMVLERTICLGFCPAYRISIYGNGVVVWEGRDFVRVKGARLATVSDDTVRLLFSAFNRSDYFNLQDAYTKYQVTDNPSAVTAITIGGKHKSVTHYYGDLTAPTRLEILENQIDEILDTNAWIK